MSPTVSSRRRTGVLYAGVAVFVALAAFTASSIWTAWQERSGEARAEAVFDLVEQRMPPRPTDAPGAMAWLRLELSQYRLHVAGRGSADRAAQYANFAAASESVPLELRNTLSAMQAPGIAAGPVRLLPEAQPAAASLRRQRLAAYASRTFVVTRRRAIDTPDLSTDSASNRFVAALVPRLADVSRDIDARLRTRPLPAVPGDVPPRPVRLYAVSEDGTLVSAPWEDASGAGPAADRELALLGGRPGLPTFAPEDFFFRFNPADSSAAAAYSGFYLDVGGRGLVSTITLPVTLTDGQRGVLALDLTFDIDWRAFAATVDPPVVGTAVTIADAGRASWPVLLASLAGDAPAPLRAAVAALAARQQRTGEVDQPSPLRHGLVDDVGAVAAFQMSDRTWLLMLFPKTAPAFPVAAVALLGVLLVALFTGFEVNRRRADDERQRSDRALAEKQNLLNTMQVPLIVVDPNTDVIVSANRAAETIGIRAGSRFADLVWPDPKARAHYEKMQVASPEPRRAYGVPVAVVDEQGQRTERYAVVRSVAVTAPIEALSADERHRLGVLFVLEPEADLALLTADIEEHAHRDERQRLAGLLSHGVDTLARVLEHCLTQRELGPERRDFVAWLSDYLERRLTVTAWVLDHWDAQPPLPRDSVVDVEQARATLARMTSVFTLARDDRDLRARLHWDNGTLSQSAANGRVLDVDLEWPASLAFTCPVRGGLGLFLGEVLANAARHGAPGTTPRVAIAADLVRKELTFEVENATVTMSPVVLKSEAYGGLEILKTLARLFEWTDLAFESSPGRFVVRWRVPASERARAGQAD